MNYLILKDIDNKKVIEIDINKMTELKKNICSLVDIKYIETKKSDTYEFRKQTIQLIDRYILHTIEEVFEYDSELSKLHHNEKNEILEDHSEITLYSNLAFELIDVISYMCSLKYLLSTKIVNKYNRNMNIKYDLDNFKINTIDEIKKELFDFLKRLIVIRRTFPERKWQYNISDCKKNDLDLLLVAIDYDLSKSIKKLIELYIKLFLASLKPDDNKLQLIINGFNEEYIDKNEKVYVKILNNK